jgi:hypothetical protein
MTGDFKHAWRQAVRPFRIWDAFSIWRSIRWMRRNQP